MEILDERSEHSGVACICVIVAGVDSNGIIEYFGACSDAKL